ncbi:unnamed protein product [Vitrella brassicaformis CCMP3155]|uniref:WW domain-containing protein n=1 Tax=Vitrella brassicaformis (strain CCMP3155) TaxID=1169540 RepID=A0A0G4FJH3_VITBC|nr:unnamed protein product [Vitrella brassicaformis CCMP3155]|eukprot:CEM13891.1 unnamed protein product [Vitrella brassicaformis CCMP3155]
MLRKGRPSKAAGTSTKAAGRSPSPSKGPRHKVVQFGRIHDTENPAYRFQFPSEDAARVGMTEGLIPVGFLSSYPVDKTYVYMEIRPGEGAPEFRTAFETPENIIEGWTSNVDELWSKTLRLLERKKLLTEGALDELDGDPFYLMGLSDPTTQNTLKKASTQPVLRCLGNRPTIEEWALYIEADLDEADAPFKWVVESFASMELPPPWTSYKGVGSIVCYLNNETNQTTWKHPFFDYFKSLLEHCRHATHEEHLKLRITRMLWSFEAESMSISSLQHPLLSPQWLLSFAEILSIDLVQEPYVCRTLKTYLKHFAHQYRHYQQVEEQDVVQLLEAIDIERDKADEIHDLLAGKTEEPNIDDLASGQMMCVECAPHASADNTAAGGPMMLEKPAAEGDAVAAGTTGKVATIFCTSCNDSFCEACFTKIHGKGDRRNHRPVRLIPCSRCLTLPAKLQCTYTFENFCHRCYAMIHVKELPPHLDLRPRRITYSKKGPLLDSSRRDADVTLLWRGPAWHTFYDIRGIPFHYNFETDEAMRRDPVDSSISSESPGPTTQHVSQEEEQAVAAAGRVHPGLTNIANVKKPPMLKGLFTTPR